MICYWQVYEKPRGYFSFAGLFAYRVQLCLLVAFESIDIASEIGCEDHVAVC